VAVARSYIVGVVENGAPRDERLVPSNPRKPIRYTRGATHELYLTVLTPDGVPVNLGTGEASLLLTIKVSSEDEEYVLRQTGTIEDADEGAALFTIPPTAFRDYAPGRYIFDIWLTQSGAQTVVLPASPFIVEPSVRTV